MSELKVAPTAKGFNWQANEEITVAEAMDNGEQVWMPSKPDTFRPYTTSSALGHLLKQSMDGDIIYLRLEGENNKSLTGTVMFRDGTEMSITEAMRCIAYRNNY